MSDSVGGTGGVSGAAEDVVEAVALAGWRRGAGLAGAAIGVVAAGAAAGVALERLTVGRGMRRKARLALDAAGPYGTLRGTPGTAVAEDGTKLAYEVEDDTEFAYEAAGGTEFADEIEGVEGVERVNGFGSREGAGGGVVGSVSGAGAPAPTGSNRREGHRTAPPVTVVFCHGYCLSQDSWHFQRAALAGVVRAVYWDQRSHGRSERGRSQSEGGEPVTIDLLGRDLKAVIDAAAPEGPLVLVGHSMGGMTIMALAAQFPELVRRRVVGAAFIGTSAGKLSEVSFGLPVVGVRAVRRVLPGVLRALGSQTELVERSRRATADLFAGVIKRYSFGSRDVDPGVARFAERLIEATPIDVVAEFYPAFAEHDKSEALPTFDGLPVLVLAGERDLITPSEHSEAIAEFLPRARLEIVPGAGHLVMLEHPETVYDSLLQLLDVAGVPGAAGAAAGNGGNGSASGSGSGSRDESRGGGTAETSRTAPG
ncbi:alpha/beta fold hydrolase [Streptomyces zagrosensis]|uniref:Pimeloyl-ACP methyl ester carboxylesterase n=1 Tax=Streptomyces zagrosensis TaxID=1042984 RepID=A0A7W9QII2_9ACTN|nr:alpha/beta hydrolase [Streptomyces zagrosensis]MBB5939592.1 pimeloyl-ACP methyl ester carboxylesterase [Streptomyces zagrosensis]